MSAHSRFRLPILRVQPLAACMAAALACGCLGAIAAQADAPGVHSLPGSALDRLDAFRGSREMSHTRQSIAAASTAQSIAKSATHPDSITVTNCDDSGSGSLRDAVQNLAASGDVIDLTQLTCSTISLTTGSIIVAENDLTLRGPASDSLTIDGANDPLGYGVLFHNGTGTLEVDHLTIAHGAKYTNTSNAYAQGGCIFSSGNVTLNYSTVSNCSATAAADLARGGGIYAHGNVMLDHSTITGNLVHASGNSVASGGGLFVRGSLTASDSIISQNVARIDYGERSYAGGVAVIGSAAFTDSTVSDNSSSVIGGISAYASLTLTGSTISGNQAGAAGGLLVFDSAAIINSTISGNVSSRTVGAAQFYGPATVYNSTIAFNRSSIYAGLATRGATLHLESSIIAGNGDFGEPDDLNAMPNTVISGSHNLISASAVPVPPDTITACPRLGPLADNGGPTLTHALLHTSPAIDMGDNFLALPSDQRGTGFPRVFRSVADIGAFEWQGVADDRVFNSGFESICDH